MRYARIAGLVVILALITGLALSLNTWGRSHASPASLTGPNLLPNNDFALDADEDGLPDGWTAADAGGVRRGEWVFEGGGQSMEIQGINNGIVTVTSSPRTCQAN